MFTGIVAAVGRIEQAQSSSDGLRLTIDAGALSLDDVALGDSIAVSGICLTVVVKGAHTFSVDVSAETLRCTVGLEDRGARVNLEKALRLADRLGGHLLTGHVDGIGTIRSIRPEQSSNVIEVEIPHTLSRYVARKGSVGVNGVSLTVNDVQGEVFRVNLIPHTLEVTTLNELKPGDRVNIEVDLIARYIEQLMKRD